MKGEERMRYERHTLPEMKQKEAGFQRALDNGKGNKKEIERHLRIIRSKIRAYQRAFSGE